MAEVFNCSQEDENRLEVLRKNGTILLTDDQKQAVLASGHILVSAAAGSGKTSTMVQRIMLMISEGVSLRDMLVLVYNTAAADELKERLHQELFEKACTTRGEQRESFRRELDDLPFCHICTIHAFCSTLIRDNFDKLGLSPSFEVLDEQAHFAYMNAALENVLDEYSKKNDEIFGDIVEVFSQARKEDNLRTNIIKLHTLMDIQPDKQAFKNNVEECFSDFENSKFMGILEQYYKSFFDGAKDKLASNLEMISTTSLQKYIVAVSAAIALCEDITSAKSFREMCLAAGCYQKPELGKRIKIEDFEKRISDVSKSYLDEMFDVVDELSSLSCEFERFEVAHAQNAVYISKIIELTEYFDNELKKLKEADNVLSFEDLQHNAVKLLTEFPEIGGVYRAVFVDEYQDVNPTQEFIIQALVKDECFMVGDVKQSIYGFRLADPTIFLSRRDRYKNGEGVAIDFNRNFRSSRAILEFVNGVFNAVMTEKSADVDYKNTSAFELSGAPEDGYVQVHLFSDKKAERRSVSGVYDITAPEQDDDGISASEAEGQYIASEINSLVGRAIVGDRRMRYGDIAILFRSRSKGASKIVEQLKNAGIPVDESVFGKSVSRPERELINMLRVLDNPMQDIPLAGYLLSFFAGYDESELAEVAALEGDCLYDKVKLASLTDTPLGLRLRDTLKTLEVYRTKASFKNVAELMNGIVSDFCYDAYLMKSGEADVYGLNSFIASAAEQNDKSLGKFLEGYAEGADSRVLSGGGDRVHISTFHAYKGLEIPAVFVADAAYGFNYESGAGDLSALGNGYIGLKYFDFENRFKYNTLSKLAVAKLNKTGRIKEEMRLFYVALTRAKQMMYVTASLSAKKSAEFGEVQRIGSAGCDLDFISSAICEGSVDAAVLRHSAEQLTPTVRKDEHIVLPVDKQMVEEIAKGRKSEYPYKISTKLAQKYSVSSLDGADEPTINVYSEETNVGTLYHKVMQYIDFFAQGAEGVRAELNRMVAENILTEQDSLRIDCDVIAKCLNSELMESARKAQLIGKCMREQPFMMYKAANEIRPEFGTGDKVLIQGVVDLFIGGGSKILVDFKYSRMSDENLAEKYKSQLYLYKTAIESAINAKIDRIVIYSFKSGTAIDLNAE